MGRPVHGALNGKDAISTQASGWEVAGSLPCPTMVSSLSKEQGDSYMKLGTGFFSGMRRVGLVGAVASLLLASACEGTAGRDGSDGVDGLPGADGRDGRDGLGGKDGQPGSDGKDGTNGSGGPAGPEGPPGTGTKWLSFEDVGFPRTNAEKHQARSSKRANVNGEVVDIDYHVLLRSGEDPSRPGRLCDIENHPENCFGLKLDKNNKPILDDSGRPYIENSNDFTSIIRSGENLYVVNQFETLPAGMFVTKVNQDAKTGMLSAEWSKSVDLSSVDGLWVACAGSVTPWESHLASEEYPVDARTFAQIDGWAIAKAAGVLNEVKFLAAYRTLDVTDVDGDGLPDLPFHEFLDQFSPYYYGYPVEIRVAEDGSPTPIKHYAMGRVSLELAYVLPDQKTVLLTDDGSNTGLFMFVADKAGDLSAGHLYAMRFYQTTPAGSVEFAGDLEWIDLGHATNAEIHAMLHPKSGSRIEFADIFEVESPDGVNCTSPDFRLTRGAASSTLECLKLKPGMEKAASRLETRRYASYLGATTEMNKEEGVTFDPDHGRAYVALTSVSGGTGPQPGIDHINVAGNSCGGVYALDIGPWTDANGKVVTEYAPLNWYPLVTGVPMSYPADSPYAGNSCSVGGIASPDNLTYLPGYDTLIIGEDTSRHQNDAMWSYNVKTGKLTRIFTTPYGSETTSPYWFPNVNGFGYLMSVIQHPYGESDQARIDDPEATGTASWLGVIGPFPALD